MPDPNAKRDQALKDIAHGLNTIARELVIQNRFLKTIAKNSQPQDTVVSNAYLERTELDGDDGTADGFLEGRGNGAGAGDNNSTR